MCIRDRIWSPDAEPMDLRHYDNVAHDLNASYEDVQEGMSTPYGIARTTTLTLIPPVSYTHLPIMEVYQRMYGFMLLINFIRHFPCTVI